MANESAYAHLRIGIDARRYLSQSGGVANVTRRLVASLAQAAPSAEYALFYQGLGSLADRGFPFSIAVPILVDYVHKQSILPVQLALRKVDVFLCLAQPGLVWAPCPTVVYVHDIPADFEISAPPSRLLSDLIIPMTVQRATRIVAVSEHTKRHILEKTEVSPEKISVVYEGVDPARFSPIPRAHARQLINQLQPLKTRIVLTVLSSFAPRKNLPSLVQAYSLLPDRMVRDTSLVVVGRSEGWSGIRQELGNSISQEVLDSVICTGYVEDHLLPYYYNAADVFAFPSLHEGFGLPVLEAMSCGVPVICSNAASLPEVVGDAGILVDPRDGAEMANAIANVLGDDALRVRLSQAGRARAATFTPEREAAQLLEVLAKTARSKRPRT